jgi:hypothetical protein
MPMTYDSLVIQVTKYLNTTNAVTIDQITNFIYQAEQRIARESKTLGLVVYVTGAFTPNEAVLPKPARWRRTLTFNFGTGIDNNTRNQIFLTEYDFLRYYWPNPTVTGEPKFYADYGFDHLIVAPTPDEAYPFEYSYLQLPEPLSEDVQTNWLTNNAPDVLLYATLLEAIPFIKNDDRIPVWESFYMKAIASLNGQDSLRIKDRASDRKAD